MREIFDNAADGDAPDLLNTTIKAKELDDTAHELGRGDTADLESAGLQAKSNAAVSAVYETRNRKKKNEAALTALELALLNPEYRQHYEAVWQKIDDTQAALDEAILENAEHIEALENNAMRTVDGRMIFQTEDGFVYADGSAVAKQDEPDPSAVRKDATQWRDYKAATERRDELVRIQIETLDPIRRRMNDHDNPPDRPTLDDFDKRLEDAQAVIEERPISTIEEQPEPEALAELQILDDYSFPSPVG